MTQIDHAGNSNRLGIGRTLLAFALGSAVVLAVSASAKVASAAPSCSGNGFLCFFDYNTSQYGSVSGSNRDWGAFGWQDRADVIRNDGLTSNACVYQDINYRGTWWYVPRNHNWYDLPDNTISSNWWMTSTNPQNCNSHP